MSLKIDVSQIITDHIDTITNANDGKANGWDYISFLLAPAALSIGLIALNIYFKVEFVDIVVSGLSIFVGLLFNIIVILFDIVKTEKLHQDKSVLIKEVVINISFCILLSLVAIITSLSTQLNWGKWFLLLSNSVTYVLLGEFLITLLMILKRMYNIFIDEINGVMKSKTP